MKIIYCIRHGEALHNVNYHKFGSNTFYDPNFVDTSLTDEGFIQADKFKKTWEQLNSIELVIVSPLLRTLQTAHTIFKDMNIPIIALDIAREYPLGLHTCNQRSSKQYYEQLFPSINFDNLSSNLDTLWNHEREETIDELNIRIQTIIDYLSNCKESTIAFVNHSSFMGQMIHKKIRLLDNNEKELVHCYPYKFQIE